MKEIKLPPLSEALMKRILRSDKQDPYSRQKLLNDFQEFYEPKKLEEKKSYSQNWKIYYQACKDEGMMFLRILKDAVDYKFHDFHKDSADAPKMELHRRLLELDAKMQNGEYDNCIKSKT